MFDVLVELLNACLLQVESLEVMCQVFFIANFFLKADFLNNSDKIHSFITVLCEGKFIDIKFIIFKFGPRQHKVHFG